MIGCVVDALRFLVLWLVVEPPPGNVNSRFVLCDPVAPSDHRGGGRGRGRGGRGRGGRGKGGGTGGGRGIIPRQSPARSPPIVDRDGFTLVQSHHKRGGPPKHSSFMWVSRVRHGDPEKVRRYLESRYIRIYNIDKVSHPKSKFNSFKICLHKDDINTVYEHNFWPRGVWCDEWRDPWEERRRSTD